MTTLGIRFWNLDQSRKRFLSEDSNFGILKDFIRANTDLSQPGIDSLMQTANLA